MRTKDKAYKDVVEVKRAIGTYVIFPTSTPCLFSRQVRSVRSRNEPVGVFTKMKSINLSLSLLVELRYVVAL